VSPAKIAEPIEMLFLFGLRTWVGPRHHVLDEGPDPPWEGAIICGKGWPILKYRDALPWSLQNGWIDRDAVWVVDLGRLTEAQVQSYSPGCAMAPPGEHP